MKKSKWRYIGFLGSLLVIISAFLPWASIDLWVITQKIIGFRVDGMYTFLMGGTAFGFLIWKPGKFADFLTTFLGIAIVWVLYHDFHNFEQVLVHKKYFFGIDIKNQISVGYGAILTSVGGLILIIYGIIALLKKRPQ
ncbi:hypothetical protein [Tepidibacillus marianensis]|uniref:hypothetical protein n=1 Tax=Tepidibacillus marianensis TaxID=3131995 RepID=UPI0030CFDF85